MTLFLIGTALTLAGLVLVGCGKRRGESDDADGWWLSIGYPVALFGPFLLCAYLFSLPVALLLALGCCAAVRFLTWVAKQIGSRWLPSGATYHANEAFPLVLAVCALRFFIVEPYHVPSSSMRPTLVPGDYVIADKFAYGLRLPLTGSVLISTATPHIGDVVVFRYPLNPREVFVKRVIGRPGDVVEIVGKRVSVNGVPIKEYGEGAQAYRDDTGQIRAVAQMRETDGGRVHDVLYRSDRPWLDTVAFTALAPANGCQLRSDRLVCNVPTGSYFVMGDNRDDSLDSRYWGFVPDRMILGRVDFVAVNPDQLQRAAHLVR